MNDVIVKTVRSEREARVAWTQLVEPGDGDAGELIAERGASAALHDLGSDRLGGDERWRSAVARWSPRLPSIDIEAQRRRARTAGARFLVPGDDHWPANLDDLGVHTPIGLWVRGDAEILARRAAIAIVGARAASGYGEHVAAELAAELCGAGAVIVSGAAYGIDGAAHRAALAGGGATIAVLAGGVDRVYPAGHATLIAEIVRAGAVISEVALGTTPSRWRFLQRNRIIAALGMATVVVEAGWRSGSLNTAGHAATLGRPLGAVPGPVTSASSAGCHRLLREYDATCVTDAADVWELAGYEAATVTGNSPEDPRLTRVLDALGPTPCSTAVVASTSGLSVAETEAVLAILELGGRVSTNSAGWARAPRELA